MRQRREYYVYVIELHPDFGLTAKAREANPSKDPSKPCIYVGSSSKTPEERFDEHIEGRRSAKDFPLFSRVVKRWGVRLLPQLYEDWNPIGSQDDARTLERRLAEKYRRLGYTVWWN